MGDSISVFAGRFADVLGELVRLSQSERDALAALEQRERRVRRGAILQRENQSAGEMFIVRQGLVMSYVLLADGSRQILRFLHPGDMIGLPGMIYREVPETLCALTESIVSPFDRRELGHLMNAHPRLGQLILVYSQIERAILTDRLAALGRTSAKARVGALLLELRSRLQGKDALDTDGFVLNLTQEEIGDATGLTAVHVNRMLRQLEEEGLIVRDQGRVRVIDARALMEAANFVDRSVGLDLTWLPPPR